MFIMFPSVHDFLIQAWGPWGRLDAYAHKVIQAINHNQVKANAL